MNHETDGFVNSAVMHVLHIMHVRGVLNAKYAWRDVQRGAQRGVQ